MLLLRKQTEAWAIVVIVEEHLKLFTIIACILNVNKQFLKIYIYLSRSFL